MDDFLENIRAKARGLGVTPAGLCALAGVHPTTFDRWRRGETTPQLGTLRRILDYERPREISKQPPEDAA